jgi:hypothetical protein
VLACSAWRTPGRPRYGSSTRSATPEWRAPISTVETGLSERVGQVTTAPTPFRQRTADFVEFLHSTSSLARAWMTPVEAAAFDRAATEVIAPFEADGWLDMTVVAEVSWGTVRAG